MIVEFRFSRLWVMLLSQDKCDVRKGVSYIELPIFQFPMMVVIAQAASADPFKTLGSSHVQGLREGASWSLRM